jgi:hypothetical protein
MTVCKTVVNLASQMARLTVRNVRDGSMTARTKHKAQPARCVVTDLHLVGRSPYTRPICQSCQANDCAVITIA